MKKNRRCSTLFHLLVPVRVKGSGALRDQDEAVRLGAAGGARGRRGAEFNVSANGAQIELHLRQVLALGHGFERALVELRMDRFGLQRIAEQECSWLLKTSSHEHGPER